MKTYYLPLAIVGTILPNIFVVQEAIATGNYFLYRFPVDTFQQMFVNNVSSAFAVDLLFIVFLFFIWSFQQAKKHHIKNVWIYWIYTMLLGIAGGLPLFLYFREKHKV